VLGSPANDPAGRTNLSPSRNSSVSLHTAAKGPIWAIGLHVAALCAPLRSAGAGVRPPRIGEDAGESSPVKFEEEFSMDCTPANAAFAPAAAKGVMQNSCAEEGDQVTKPRQQVYTACLCLGELRRSPG
jgi:hypothetical protein